MSTTHPPTDNDYRVAEALARTVCDHLQRADVSHGVIHEVATSLAVNIGKNVLGKSTITDEQVIAAAVDDYLCPPSDDEGEGYVSEN